MTRIGGRFSAMKNTIDSAGQVVIPREIQQEAGIQPGMPLEIRWHEGPIEIEPALPPCESRTQGEAACRSASAGDPSPQGRNGGAYQESPLPGTRVTPVVQNV